MLITPATSCLLVIDIQEKLFPAIHNQQQVLVNSQWLVEIARQLSIPTLACEQYPQGLGHTVAPLQASLADAPVLTKLHFSCAKAEACQAHLQALARSQIVIVGTEAHVCVLQSAIGLKQLGYEVYVVEDAVGSRRSEDKQCALQRLRDNGITVVCREMVAFEWLEQAGTETFRQISRNYLR